MRICTVVTSGSLPAARVLAGGLTRHHPEATLEVLAACPTRPDDPFEAIGLDDVDLPEARGLLADEWPLLRLLLVPALLRRALDAGAPAALYLAPEVDVRAPLTPLLDQLGHAAMVTVPRLEGEPPDDGLRPGRDELLELGRVDPGCVAAADRPQAREALDWWLGALREARATLPPRIARDPGEPAPPELTVCLDLLASRVAGVEPLDDPSIQVSAFNLHERPLTAAAPPRSFSFAGFRPDRPYWLAEGADRVRVPDEPLLGELTADYARRLLAAGWAQRTGVRDVGRTLPTGVVFDERMAQLALEAELVGGADFGDLFSPDGAERFTAWLCGPAPHGGHAGVNRYLYRVYRERADLPVAYPDLDGPDGEGFAGWAWVFGQREMGVDPAFLPPPPAGIETEVLGGSAAGDDGGGELSVNVAGYFTGTLGIGAAARLYLEALHAGGIATSTTTVEVRLPEDAPDAPAADYGKVRFSDRGSASDAGFNLVCVNPDELGQFAEVVGEGFFAARPTIGVWAWETDDIPGRWAPHFEVMDEIWVYSRFVAENIGRASPVPVVPVPIPILRPDPHGAWVGLDLPSGFRFLFLFDFFSTVQRKNPVGVIEAFKRAFPDGGPHLVIKTLHAHHRPRAFDALRWAADGRDDVRIVDVSLPVEQRDALLVSCDCYVSLHRSEGYGLTPAECMSLGKPVIATAYGGVTDFMTPANSYLVEWAPTLVGPEGELYPASGTWAEPDLDHAAALMRRVVERPGEAAEKGARAREDVERELSPAAVGAIVRDRLTRLAARRAAGAPRASDDPNGPPIEALDAALRGAEANGGRGVRRVLRRGALRAMRPYTVHARAFDEAVADTLRTMRRDLDRMRERDAR